VLILDTDTLTFVQNIRSPLHGRIIERLRNAGAELVFATVVSFQEQARGWISKVGRAKTAADILFAYKSLKGLIHDYCTYSIVPYDDEGHARFEEIHHLKLRVGTMDLRIAAIALAKNATLLTRNVRDFRQVPGLTFEDWAR
jgi:tRNA(fMet)-specific endonuclease VapC